MKILVIIGFTLFAIDIVSAQGAFDPNCYYPKIGVEIDTIYGSKNEQQLGAGTENIGPLPGESYGRVGMLGLQGSQDDFTSFNTGPGFNLRNIQKKKVHGYSNMGKGGNIIQYGHFRSPKYRDMLIHNIDNQRDTIFWSDENGEYDDGRFTVLSSSITPDSGGIFHFGFIGPTYTDYLTSDSIEDVIHGGAEAYLDRSKNQYYLFLYKGGESLYSQGKFAYPDSILPLGNLLSSVTGYACISGDFRGVGRKDLVIYSSDSSRANNLMYYRNQPPFKLGSFYRAMLYDTLMTVHENGIFRDYEPSFYSSLVMSAYRRNPNDRTVDFFQMARTNDERDNGMWLFKGGPDFGSKRLYLDSASFYFWHPSHYDNSFSASAPFFPGIDAGDMTGTGNRVMVTGQVLPIGLTNVAGFYVLGDAMDDKIDIFISQPNHPSFGGDTITVNSDGLQDFILSMSRYASDEDILKGKDHVGSIGILEGTTKIPVKVNGVNGDKYRKLLETVSLFATPNPFDQKTTLTFENCTSGVMYMEVVNGLGVSVLREEIPDVEGLQQYAADLSGLPAGAYHIRLVCPADGWSASTSVIKTGAAVAPWSLNLKKMVGR